MAASMNGPDWTDVATMMEAISTLHECRIVMTLTTAGQGHNGHLVLQLCATFDVLHGSEKPVGVIVGSTWPNTMGTDLASTTFRGLYDLDFAIGEVYQQRFLPGVE